jgi:hypothetical protein
MLIAVSQMDPTVQMILYGAAVALFVLSAVGYTYGKISLIGAGLACFAFPFFWNALAVS